MIKEFLIATAVATAPYQPKIKIRVTEWLAQSIQTAIQVQEALCKVHYIPQKECVDQLSKEILSVRELVDSICEQKAKPEEQEMCIIEGVEYILDNQIIPSKIRSLQYKSI